MIIGNMTEKESHECEVMERILMEMVSYQAKNATSSFGDMEIKQYGRGILAR